MTRGIRHAACPYLDDNAQGTQKYGEPCRFQGNAYEQKRQQLEYPERRKRVLTERTREFVLSNPVNKQVSIPRHVRYTVRRAPEPQRVYLGGLTLPGSLSFVTTVRVQKDARQNTEKIPRVRVQNYMAECPLLSIDLPTR